MSGIRWFCALLLGAFVVAVPASARAESLAACPTTLRFGDVPAACAIGKAGEIDTFWLSATAGDGVFLHAVGSGIDVDFEVRDPGDKPVCAARAGAATDALCKIPATARYMVLVFDSGGDETGSYRLDAQRVNKPVGAAPLTVARPLHSAIATAGEADWYTFKGAANALVVVRGAVLAAAPMEVDLDLFGPTGDAVCATRAGSSAQSVCTLPSTGSYTLRVDDSADDETGGYALTVRPECTIVGTSAGETLAGTPGNDVICALGGADVVTGGDGNDVIIGGTGDDKLDGGAGNDVFLSERSDDGSDTVVGGLGATDVLSYAERSNAVAVDADAQPDDGEDGEADDVRADVEVLQGGAGNDTLAGSSRTNTLLGGPGDDRLVGNAGKDALDGGDGTDTCAPESDGGSLSRCEVTSG